MKCPDNHHGIFVFGSNLAGRHGKGGALHARLYHGARIGQGVGRQGNSYAIPTRGYTLITLPLIVIRTAVDIFLGYAKEHPTEYFFLTRIGCGLAGYKDEEIAPFFLEASPNIILPEEWIAA